MADLSTDFKDDVLNEEINTKRRYQMIYNDDGTVSFEDVTNYTQVGSEFGAKEVNEERTEINNRLPLSGGTLTGNLAIHKNDPYLRLKNAQGGDQEVGLHYYGSTAGENIFGIYDFTGQTHWFLIRQETKQADFAGGVRAAGSLQSIGANNYGVVYAGDKIYMRTDADGGNLRIYTPAGNGNFWEADAYNGNLRFYHYDTEQGKITAQFNWGASGTVSAPFVLNALTATAAGYVLDARQGKALNDKITALQSSLSPKALASINNPTVNSTISFTTSAPLLMIDFSNGSACESMIIMSGASSVSHMMSLVWSPTTLSRVTFRRTSAGIQILSFYSCGEWASAAHSIVVKSVG